MNPNNEISNPLLFNDWDIRTFIIIVITIQIALLSLSFINTNLIQIPFLIELISFIDLIFIPGYVILRILKLHNLSEIESVLFSVGLSVSFLIFIGFTLNMILPIIGFENPLTTINLVITFIGSILVLTVLCFIIDKNSVIDEKKVKFNSLFNPSFFYLCIIPFLSIFGTFILNNYNNNILLIANLILIAFTVILAVFEIIPKKYYPLAIFSISLSLLLHTSLISNYVWGWDIQQEYYLSNLVLSNNYWNYKLPYEINSMMSITILAPILSKISTISLTWIFKIVYPFLFSLVPLGLYYIFKNQTNKKIAFLSVFFFMSIFTFYIEMNQLARQEIAELFFVLLIILLVSETTQISKKFLFVIFSFSMVISHYGLSYIFIIYLIASYLIILILDTKKLSNLKENRSLMNKNTLTMTFILLFVTFAFAWYIYSSSSYLIERILNIGNHISSTMFTDLLNPDTVQGLSVLNVQTSSFLHSIAKYLNLMFQSFIVIGLFCIVFFKNKFKKEYLAFTIVSLFLLVLSMALPYFASALNMTRIYHITLFFLAPLSILGGIFFIQTLGKIVTIKKKQINVDYSLKIISILLVTIFLFFNGVVYELSGDDPTSFAISNIDYPVFSNTEFNSAGWLNINKQNYNKIYADPYRQLILIKFLGDYNKLDEYSAKTWITPKSYLFMGNINTKENKILVSFLNATKKNSYVNSGIYIKNKDLLYDNGYSTVYYNT